ncbi:MAG: hypothetical protein HY775_02320 [Acidobacteria bacterium]|nr:hypothetical protein [Acidobacteriota bacterium]
MTDPRETPPEPGRAAGRLGARPWGAVHPLLLAAFPVLSLFAANLGEVTFEQVRVPLAASVVAAAVLLLAAWSILRDLRRAALVVSIAVTLFFSYGRVFEPLRDRRLGGVLVGRHLVLLPLWAILGAGLAALALRARGALPRITKGMNAAAFVLVLTTVVSMTSHGLARSPASAADAPIPTHSPAGLAGNIARQPDIYYIILDRYAGNDALRRVFGFDNSEFLRSLRALGFSVPAAARPNYPNTTLSLASSLNMDYLDEPLTRRVGGAVSNWKAARRLFERTAVVRYLKERGYEYANIGSWWEGTRKNALADRNYVYDPLSEFSRVLLQTTAAWPLAKRFGADRVLDVRESQWNRVHFQFRAIEETRKDFRGPAFVFAHLTLPHDPYVFDRDGSFQDAAAERAKDRRQAYVDQLVWTNRRVHEMLRVLMAGPERDRPVIILQSDEGPNPIQIDGRKPKGWTWSGATERQIQVKFRILEALYLPGIENSGFYPTITPVNIFRVVFNVYFNAGFPLRKDRSYIFPDWGHLYTFVDVTERVARWPAGINPDPPGHPPGR